MYSWEIEEFLKSKNNLISNEEYFEICKSSQISHIKYEPHENIFHIWTKEKDKVEFEFVFRVKKVEELEELKAKEYKKEKN